jgi:hypothetical protein
MSSEPVRTHAIDMSAIAQKNQSNKGKNETSIQIQDLNLFYGEKQALHGINMEIPKKQVTDKGSVIRNSRCLLHIMSNNNNGIGLFQLIN